MAPWFRWRPALLVREGAPAGGLGRHSPPQPADRAALGGVTQAPRWIHRTDAHSPAHRHGDPEAHRPAPVCVPRDAQRRVQTLGNTHSLSRGPRSHRSHRGTHPIPALLPPSRVHWRVALSNSHTQHTNSQGPTEQRLYTKYPGPTRGSGQTNSLSSADFPSTVLTSAHRYTRPLNPEDSHHQLPRKPPTQRCPLTWQLGHTSSLSAPLSTSQSFGGKALCLWAKGPQGHFHSPWAAGMGLQLLC